MVSDLTALPIANASLLDEGTAAAEALALMRRNSKAPAGAVLVADRHLLPQTIDVVTTRATPLSIDVVVTDLDEVTDADGLRAAAGDRDVMGVLLQYPAPTASSATGPRSPPPPTSSVPSSRSPPTCSR